MYRVRFLKTMLKCLVSPTRGLLDSFEVEFLAIPFVDTDVSRLFTQTYTLYMGICRWHFVFNSVFRNVALKNSWVPVTTAETIEYRKSIKAFDRVAVKTKLIYWDEKRFFLEQVFWVRGKVHAHCYVEGLIRSPKGILQPPSVFRELGVQHAPPEMPPQIRHWLSARSAPKADDKT